MTNSVSIKMSETIDVQRRAPMSSVEYAVLVACEGQTPSIIRRDVCITKDYFKESFEAIYYSDNDDDQYTLAHYERTIENGTLKEMFAHDHMFSIADIEVYLETPTDNMFPSDSMFFGKDLIKVWGKWEECVKEVLRKAQSR
jgi:hypothetical protein